MPEQKTYVPRSGAKKIDFQNGGSMLKLSFHADTLASFVKQHANEKGWINICVTARREVSAHGDTHCVWLDTWKPKANDGQAQQGFQKMKQAAQTELPPSQDDNPPF